MKKLLALILAGVMLLALASCTQTENQTGEDQNSTATADPGADQAGDKTVGETLLAEFKTLSGSAEEIANKLLQNEMIQFMGMAMPVEEGLLNGFDNTEIRGFKEGVMFGPAIGSIPFIGYIFVLEDGADVAAFKKTLDDAANLRWNICVSADEKIVESKDNTVFFLMCPKNFEQEESAGDVGGMDLLPEDQLPAADGEMMDDTPAVGDFDLSTPAADGEEIA